MPKGPLVEGSNAGNVLLRHCGNANELPGGRDPSPGQGLRTDPLGKANATGMTKGRLTALWSSTHYNEPYKQDFGVAEGPCKWDPKHPCTPPASYSSAWNPVSLTFHQQTSQSTLFL